MKLQGFSLTNVDYVDVKNLRLLLYWLLQQKPLVDVSGVILGIGAPMMQIGLVL